MYVDHNKLVADRPFIFSFLIFWPAKIFTNEVVKPLIVLNEELS